MKVVRYRLSAELVEKLRRRNPGGEVAAEVMAKYNAFVLDLGLGPACYLTLDGQILIDERWWFGDGIRQATENESISALVVGAEKSGIHELLDLIPPPPAESHVCRRCNGLRWATLGAKDVQGNQGRIVCPECDGRGWAA